MIVSSRSSGRPILGTHRLLAIAVLCLLCAAGLASGPASAQEQVGKPIQLVPQTTPDYGTAPPPPQSGTGAGSGQPSAPQGFEIAPLEAVGTDYAGTLEPAKGGLGIDM